jgi:hypothetical protein
MASSRTKLSFTSNFEEHHTAHTGTSGRQICLPVRRTQETQSILSYKQRFAKEIGQQNICNIQIGRSIIKSGGLAYQKFVSFGVAAP